LKDNLTAEKDEIDVVNKLISLKIKSIRIEKGYSQLEIANLMGFNSPTFFGHAEANRENKYFNMEHIYMISKIFNVDMHKIIPNSQEISRTLLKNSNKILKK